MSRARASSVLLWRAFGLARRFAHRLAGFRPPAHAEPLDRLAARLAAQDRPVTVGFVVCSPAKWSLHPLFLELQNDPRFTPVFYPTLTDAELRQPASARQAAFAKTRAFFAEIGPIAQDLYCTRSDRLFSADAILADLVFLQQPWGMQDVPRQLYGRVLSAYVHYGYPVISNERMQFGLPGFHPFLWCHFVADDIQAKAARNSGLAQARHVLVTGHPKLDVYLSPAPAREAVTLWPRAHDTARKRVIFAPHHALREGSLNLATFHWSGPALLDLVRAYPDVDFVLKPHPNLEYEMTRAGGEDAARYQAVMQGWQDAPNAAVVSGGTYFDLFRSSDAMITDSGSFLAEYLPSTRPLIRLSKPDAAPLNDSGKALAQAFYAAQDKQSLNALFETVIVQNEDPLAPQRTAAIARLMPSDKASAIRVMDHLRTSLRPKVTSTSGASGSAR